MNMNFKLVQYKPATYSVRNGKRVTINLLAVMEIMFSSRLLGQNFTVYENNVRNFPLICNQHPECVYMTFCADFKVSVVTWVIQPSDECSFWPQNYMRGLTVKEHIVCLKIIYHQVAYKGFLNENPDQCELSPVKL